MFAIKYYDEIHFDKFRCGLVLDNGENNEVARYIWVPDTPESRNYLWENKCFDAKRIYIGFLNQWWPIYQFMNYYKNSKHNFDNLRDQAMHEWLNKYH